MRLVDAVIVKMKGVDKGYWFYVRNRERKPRSRRSAGRVLRKDDPISSYMVESLQILLRSIPAAIIAQIDVDSLEDGVFLKVQTHSNLRFFV